MTVTTTPNTVVTARGAGVNESIRSDRRGRAKVRVKPKPTRDRDDPRNGGPSREADRVVAARQSGANLTG